MSALQTISDLPFAKRLYRIPLRLEHAFESIRSIFPDAITTDFFIINPRDFDVNINKIQYRAKKMN